ncbi:thrombospondin type-1 domain-containing protein 4 isoform X2 [Ceratitis capitata]|uniref:thrombospondin type-1 domain-containing protein 4 isoform X2 n=1 Tax=Ceratitis capitata TaxID=7213 RepID=UPI000C6C5C60|nr:thrombospondin type-1 domain-containing protein 4 isoform X2 [Ceratitis capitata]
MWFCCNERIVGMEPMRFQRLCFLSILMISLVVADISTVERIRKHQEWLKQRNQQRINRFAIAENYSKSNHEVANLWRFPKQSAVPDQESSANEVYPESEILTKTEQEKQIQQEHKESSTTAAAMAASALVTTANVLETTPAATTARMEDQTILSVTPTTTAVTNTMSSAVQQTTTEAPKVTTTDKTPMVPTATAQSAAVPEVPVINNGIVAAAPKFSATKPINEAGITIKTTTESPNSSNPSNRLLVDKVSEQATSENSVIPSTKRPHSTTRQRAYPRWGNWSKWSECSRSCGGGVRFQQRKCINRNSSTGKRYISNACIGVYKRYHICNEQPCPAAIADFRAVQCGAFNEVDFQGHKYTWEPYIKEDAECELNCKPLGMKYFATLNSSVVDGTPCFRPAEYFRSNYRQRAMCVDGVCKAVHATGIITGLSANSGSVSCGGLICRPITGIFTRDPLPEDAYVHVAAIPAGASNISITELGNSINLLVLRTSDQKYIFNGDNMASDSGAYEALGAIFDYHRIDGLQHGDGVTEWITCLGPIRDMLELMIYSKSTNPGIKYEYLLPITSDSEENELSVESDGFLKNVPEESFASGLRSGRRRRFNWKVVGFSACSKTCGGGIQTPIVRCVRENPIRYYSQRRCLHSEKPMLNENLLRCNTQPCPAYWRLDDWSECHCQQGEGYRERDIGCVQELASGIVIHVDNLACIDEMPSPRKPCDCPKNRRRSHAARYRTAHAGSNGTHNHRGRDKNDKSGIWLMSDWNQYCSVECGTGVEYRTIFCDRSKPNSDRCDSRATPELTRPCERERDCEKGDWFAGPWSSCNGNCFNLTRSRPVYCIHKQEIVKDEICKAELKPQLVENCLHEEVEYCGPRWHYSEWSECTKSCDGGTQRRSVKCLEYDAHEATMRESAKCRYSLREPIYRSCNTQKCDEPQLELLQNDVAVSCVDEFNNCQWAVKAKLCSYDYYKQNCCYSCGAA